MSTALFAISPSIYEILLLSFALFMLAKKLRWEARWKAWIPGLRMYCLGASLKQYKDGMIYGILDIAYVLMLITNLPVMDSKLLKMVFLLELILFISVLIYRIRLFLEILKLFEASKAWIIVFVLVSWLPILIFGVSKKYQPKHGNIKEENWQAGSKPLDSSEELCKAVPLVNEGLSIQIRKRTVSKDTVFRTVEDAARIRLPKTISAENKDQKIDRAGQIEMGVT